tara:strand:- start:4 stop:198 length:195 start_codon:yes stop_codon:yes gene_type:complete
MFIKLNFRNGLTKDLDQRVIKISRIKELRPSWNDGTKILLDNDKKFKEVDESIDDIFGIIKPVQ